MTIGDDETSALPLSVKGAASQSDNLREWQSSTPTIEELFLEEVNQIVLGAGPADPAVPPLTLEDRKAVASALVDAVIVGSGCVTWQHGTQRFSRLDPTTYSIISGGWRRRGW